MKALTNISVKIAVALIGFFAVTTAAQANNCSQEVTIQRQYGAYTYNTGTARQAYSLEDCKQKVLSLLSSTCIWGSNVGFTCNSSGSVIFNSQRYSFRASQLVIASSSSGSIFGAGKSTSLVSVSLAQPSNPPAPTPVVSPARTCVSFYGYTYCY